MIPRTEQDKLLEQTLTPSADAREVAPRPGALDEEPVEALPERTSRFLGEDTDQQGSRGGQSNDDESGAFETRDGTGTQDREDSAQLDLTPGALDRASETDPVSLYYQEMRSVPLLTREGEVAIAKRIERGRRSVIKTISRTQTAAQVVIALGEQLRRGERTVRELVTLQDDDLSEARLMQHAQLLLEQIDRILDKYGAVQDAERRVAEIRRAMGGRDG